jgi:hypothetical protein
MKIRRIDTLFGILFILFAGSAATYAILHTINSIPPSYLADQHALSGS